jgi:hypothetical protein
VDKRDVHKEWVGNRVMLIPLDEHGASGRELIGWLRGIEDDGVMFSKQFYSDSLKSPMPERAKFWPWERIGNVAPIFED